MDTHNTPSLEIFEEELSRLLASESNTTTFGRDLVDMINERTRYSPEESKAFYAVAATTLEPHLSSQHVCHAAILLLKANRERPLPERFIHSVSAAVRATTTLHQNRGGYLTLLSALEVPPLRHAALETCEAILHDSSSTLPKRELREFARELISFFRRCRCEDPLKERVKGYAHNIFTVGQSIASEPQLESPEPMHNAGAQEAHHEASQILLHLIMQRPPRSTLDRLTTDDFRRIGDLSGLTLEQFKMTAEVLSQYAALDGGALDAFLRVAKRAHEPTVSAQTRTQALASFLAASRRRGVLSHEVERQILATSAEIPELPFISQAEASAADAQHS